MGLLKNRRWLSFLVESMPSWTEAQPTFGGQWKLAFLGRGFADLGLTHRCLEGMFWNTEVERQTSINKYARRHVYSLLLCSVWSSLHPSMAGLAGLFPSDKAVSSLHQQLLAACRLSAARYLDSGETGVPAPWHTRVRVHGGKPQAAGRRQDTDPEQAQQERALPAS